MAGLITRAGKGSPITATEHDANLTALVQLHQGSTAPTTLYASMLWADTATSLMKQRNTANDAWITLGSLDTDSAFIGTDNDTTYTATGLVAIDGSNVITTTANNYTHPNHSGEVTSTADGATVIAGNVVDEANLKVSNAPTNGQFLSAQSGDTGGMTWAEVDALPSQTGNSGKYLTTDGGSPTGASWAALDTDANSTTKPFYEHHATVSIDHTISTDYNAMTVGPITINATKSVTVNSGSTWVIL